MELYCRSSVSLIRLTALTSDSAPPDWGSATTTLCPSEPSPQILTPLFPKQPDSTVKLKNRERALLRDSYVLTCIWELSWQHAWIIGGSLCTLAIRACVFVRWSVWYIHTAAKRMQARRQGQLRLPLPAGPVPFPASRRWAAHQQVSPKANTHTHSCLPNVGCIIPLIFLNHSLTLALFSRRWRAPLSPNRTVQTVLL